jgi:hypothetical protein
MQPPLFRLPGLPDEIERILAAHIRPCVAITSRRVAPHPLQRGLLGRLLRRQTSPPALDVLASKFGGTPYSEEPEDPDRYLFVGQFDLAQATAVLPADHPKLTGLLRVDCERNPGDNLLRVRWFPQPSAERAVPVTTRSTGAWEARHDFRLAWSLPEGKALDELWPEWSDYEEGYPAGYNDYGDGGVHTLLGHKSSGLDEPYNFPDIAAYESLLRLPFDNTAGFHWGSNCVYIVVPRDDLARGDLTRATAVIANA